MLKIYRIFLILLLTTSSLFAQGSSGNNFSSRETLRQVEPQKRDELMNRDGLAIRSEEFFAKDSRVDLYELDISVLEAKGRTVTITLSQGAPILITSNGIKRNKETGWYFGTWSGEIHDPNSKTTYPITWDITTFSQDVDGRLRPPDPNRLAVLKQLTEDVSVVPEESYLRRDEKIVHAITGRIILPFAGTHLAITQVPEDLSYVMIYEVDQSKVIHSYDGVDDTTIAGARLSQRREDYRLHVENVKSQLAAN